MGWIIKYRVEMVWWHNVLAKFHDDSFRHLVSIKLITAEIGSSNVGISDTGLLATPLK
jgi:hypothetical protein